MEPLSALKLKNTTRNKGMCFELIVIHCIHDNNGATFMFSLLPEPFSLSLSPSFMVCRVNSMELDY